MLPHKLIMASPEAHSPKSPKKTPLKLPTLKFGVASLGNRSSMSGSPANKGALQMMKAFLAGAVEKRKNSIMTIVDQNRLAESRL